MDSIYEVEETLKTLKDEISYLISTLSNLQYYERRIIEETEDCIETLIETILEDYINKIDEIESDIYINEYILDINDLIENLSDIYDINELLDTLKTIEEMINKCINRHQNNSREKNKLIKKHNKENQKKLFMKVF